MNNVVVATKKQTFFIVDDEKNVIISIPIDSPEVASEKEPCIVNNHGLNDF